MQKQIDWNFIQTDTVKSVSLYLLFVVCPIPIELAHKLNNNGTIFCTVTFDKGRVVTPKMLCNCSDSFSLIDRAVKKTNLIYRNGFFSRTLFEFRLGATKKAGRSFEEQELTLGYTVGSPLKKFLTRGNMTDWLATTKKSRRDKTFSYPTTAKKNETLY